MAVGGAAWEIVKLSLLSVVIVSGCRRHDMVIRDRTGACFRRQSNRSPLSLQQVTVIGRLKRIPAKIIMILGEYGGRSVKIIVTWNALPFRRPHARCTSCGKDT